jgi:hypothetical protein
MIPVGTPVSATIFSKHFLARRVARSYNTEIVPKQVTLVAA